MTWFRRCKHNWEKVSEATLPSAWELSDGRITGPAHPWVFTKKHVLVAQCVDCGAIKKFETVNP